jgi:hypothetical protein
MKYLGLTLLLAMTTLLVACGGGTPPPPPADDGPPTQRPDRDPGPSRPEPTGPSRAGEFLNEYREARTAMNAMRDERRKGPDADPDELVRLYAQAGAHIHRALAYRFEHERNGHDLGALRGVRELGQMRMDWRSSPPHGDNSWREDPDYMEARALYDDFQS